LAEMFVYGVMLSGRLSVIAVVHPIARRFRRPAIIGLMANSRYSH
jgi:hypothetical protein